MADMIEQKNTSWVLVDSFVGALSDFADTTVVDVFASRAAAVREVKFRIRLLEDCHREFFVAHEIKLPSNGEIDRERINDEQDQLLSLTIYQYRDGHKNQFL